MRFHVTANFDRVTECNCSICTKKGFLHLIVSPEQFQLVGGKDELATYEFNSTFCKHCGIHPFYVPRSDPDKIDINVRCLDGIDLTIRWKELGGGDAETRALAINARSRLRRCYPCTQGRSGLRGEVVEG